MVSRMLPLRKNRLMLATLLAALFLAACGQVPDSLQDADRQVVEPVDTSQVAGMQALRPGEDAQLALLLPLSDPEVGNVATSMLNAAQLAMDEVKGRIPLNLRVYDTAGDPAIAAIRAQQAVDAGAGIILGPLFAQTSQAAGRAVRDERVLVLSFSNNPGIAGGNVFILGPGFDDSADRLLEFAARQGLGKALVVAPDNSSGTVAREAIRRAAQAHGFEIATEVLFPFSQDGAVGAAPGIAEIVRDSGADTLFLTSDSAGALGILAELLPESGVNPGVIQYLGLTRWDVPPATLSLKGLQGGWFALPDRVTAAIFAARYEAEYGSVPHVRAGLAFDAIAAVAALVAQGRHDALSADALTQEVGFRGTEGIFRLLRDGTNMRALAVARVSDGTAVIIDPAPRSFAE